HRGHDALPDAIHIPSRFVYWAGAGARRPSGRELNRDSVPRLHRQRPLLLERYALRNPRPRTLTAGIETDRERPGPAMKPARQAWPRERMPVHPEVATRARDGTAWLS